MYEGLKQHMNLARDLTSTRRLTIVATAIWMHEGVYNVVIGLDKKRKATYIYGERDQGNTINKQKKDIEVI
jgi:hypothetical protein